MSCLWDILRQRDGWTNQQGWLLWTLSSTSWVQNWKLRFLSILDKFSSLTINLNGTLLFLNCIKNLTKLVHWWPLNNKIKMLTYFRSACFFCWASSICCSKSQCCLHAFTPYWDNSSRFATLNGNMEQGLGDQHKKIINSSSHFHYKHNISKYKCSCKT